VRLIYAILLVLAVGALILLVHMQLGSPPDPRLGGCDPSDIAGGQSVELARLSSWLLTRELLGALVLAVLAYALLYFQAFHHWHIPLAWAVRCGIVVVGAALVGLFVKGLALGWVTANPGTCLAEAVQANPMPVSAAGRIIAVSWPWAVFVDGFAIGVTAGLVGFLVYLAARARRS
jgi:hypothetical protein